MEISNLLIKTVNRFLTQVLAALAQGDQGTQTIPKTGSSCHELNRDDVESMDMTRPTVLT